MTFWPEFVAHDLEHVVWKYPLPLPSPEDSVIEFAGGSIVRVDFDPAGQLCAWVLVHNRNETVRRRVVVRGTGHPLPGGVFSYLNTFQRGSFVFHAFVGWEASDD